MGPHGHQVLQVQLEWEASNEAGQPAGVTGGKDNQAACKGGLAALKRVTLDAREPGTYTLKCAAPGLRCSRLQCGGQPACRALSPRGSMEATGACCSPAGLPCLWPGST